MFTVVIQALAETSQELQQSVRHLNRQIQEVEDIASSIRRMSAYEDVIHTIRMHLENMNTEKQKLTELLAALNQIQRMYMQCERNITDYGDQVKRMNYYRSMDVIRLDSVRENIREYHIR